MASTADFAYYSESIFEVIHRDANFRFRAKPALLRLARQCLPEKRRAPNLGVKLRDGGVEAMIRGSVFGCDVTEQRAKGFQTVRAPGPWAQGANFSMCQAVRMDASQRQLHEFRQRKTCLLDGAQKLNRWALGHKNNVAFAAEELGQVCEVISEHGLLLRWREALA